MSEPHDIRLKGNTLRLMAALLTGLLFLLAGGLLGVAIGSALAAALAASALVFLTWLGLKRVYMRLFRPTT